MKLRPVHLVATAAAALVFGAVTVRTIAATGIAQPATNPADNLLRFVTRFTPVFASTCNLVFKVPLTRSLVIQNISSYIFKQSNQTYGYFSFYSDSNCSQVFGASVTDSAGASVDHNYGTGLALAQGAGLYVVAQGATGSITMTGYLILSTDANIDGPSSPSGAPVHHGASPLMP